MRIEPTVGRTIHYHPAADHPDHGQTLTAFICKVNPDGTVNLAIFDSCGHQFSRQRVKLVQEDDWMPTQTGYCAWMQYQLGQAAKTEQVIHDTDHALMRHVMMEREANSAIGGLRQPDDAVIVPLEQQANSGWNRSDNGGGQVDERGVPTLGIPARPDDVLTSHSVTIEVPVSRDGPLLTPVAAMVDQALAKSDEATRLAGE